MIDPDAEIASWRPGIEQEFEEWEKTVLQLQVAFDDAAAAADEVVRDHRAIQDRLAKVQGKTTNFLGLNNYYYLEEPIAARAHEHAQKADKAKSVLARARADLEVAKGEVTKRKRALAQLDAIIAAPVNESLEAA